MIEAITSIEAVNAAVPSMQPTAGIQNANDGGKFGNWFATQLNQVNDQLQTVDREKQILALDGTQSLHQLMINMEEAKLSFQLMLQVRNRLLEAYQEVMRTQV
jgi:flagellar hook-basal body complex protein FliE